MSKKDGISKLMKELIEKEEIHDAVFLQSVLKEMMKKSVKVLFFIKY